MLLDFQLQYVDWWHFLYSLVGIHLNSSGYLYTTTLTH